MVLTVSTCPGAASANADLADRPVRVEHVHGLLRPQTRRSSGVDPVPVICRVRGRRQAEEQPDASATINAAAALNASIRRPARRLCSLAGPTDVKHDLEFQQRSTGRHGVGPVSGMGCDGGPVAHAWNASSDSQCVTTK